MYLEKVETLPQGTPLFEVVADYKDCAAPGGYFAYRFLGKMVCPGCSRVCQFPATTRPRDRIIVRKRPKKDPLATMCDRGDRVVVRKRPEKDAQ